MLFDGFLLCEVLLLFNLLDFLWFGFEGLMIWFSFFNMLDIIILFFLGILLGFGLLLLFWLKKDGFLKGLIGGIFWIFWGCRLGVVFIDCCSLGIVFVIINGVGLIMGIVGLIIW